MSNPTEWSNRVIPEIGIAPRPGTERRCGPWASHTSYTNAKMCHFAEPIGSQGVGALHPAHTGGQPGLRLHSRFTEVFQIRRWYAALET